MTKEKYNLFTGNAGTIFGVLRSGQSGMGQELRRKGLTAENAYECLLSYLLQVSL